MNERPRICVLGGGGFIGSHLVEHLVSQGYPVTLFGRASANRRLRSAANYRIVLGDLANPADVMRAVENSDTVFHLVGSTVPKSSNENPTYDVESNLIPALHLLSACRTAGVRQVVFASSGGTVYGIPEYLPISEDHPPRPICSYGITKLAVEHFMRLESRQSRLDVTILRLSNPFGPRQTIQKGQGVIATFAKRIVAGQALSVWGDGSVVRDYIPIDDVVRAMERVIGRAEGYRVYNLGSGIGRSLMDIIAVFKEISGRPIEVNYLPSRDIDVPTNVLDITRFSADFSWHCERDFSAAVGEVVEWYGGGCDS